MACCCEDVQHHQAHLLTLISLWNHILMCSHFLRLLHCHTHKQRKLFSPIYLPITHSLVCRITETKYALSKLGAVGIGLMSNHEGYYLGNPLLQPFFASINAIPGTNHVTFIHPTLPCLHYENQLIEANPSSSHSPSPLLLFPPTLRLTIQQPHTTPASSNSTSKPHAQ